MRRCDSVIPTLTGRSATGMQQGLHSKSKQKQFRLTGPLRIVSGVADTEITHRTPTPRAPSLTFFFSEDSHSFDSPFLNLVSLCLSSGNFKINYMHRNAELETNYILCRNISYFIVKVYLGKTKLFKIDSYPLNLSH